VNYANLNYTHYTDLMNPSTVEDAQGNYYPKDQYPFQEEAYKLIGAAMEVHKILGKGFVEGIYHEAYCIELSKRGIPYESNKVLHVFYKEVKLKKTFSADIFAYDKIIVELKAIEGSLDPHNAQMINYLSASKNSFGLLFNFGTPSLQYRRFIFTKNRYDNWKDQ